MTGEYRGGLRGKTEDISTFAHELGDGDIHMMWENLS
jgi:hypothetical protein